MKLMKLAIVAAILAISLGISSPAIASDPSGLINTARVHTNENRPEGTQLAWTMPQVKRFAVTAINRATTIDHNCDGCVGEAVAFQIVLASDTHLYTLTNTAQAANLDCETCTAVAVAEQWVVGATNGTVVLSQAGQAALQGVEAQVVSDMAMPPSAGLQAILAAADEVSTILAADVSVSTRPNVPAPASPSVAPLAQPGPSSLPTIQHFAQVSG